tara:strand:+ start:402 stop:1385 length:984 start_codon:yes stop_codon:yes gene_type:complete
MATDFKYAAIQDLTKYFNRVNDFNSKFQLFNPSTDSNLHTFHNSGYVDKFFINGDEQQAQNSNDDTPNANNEWLYTESENKLEYYNDAYTAVTINEQVFEGGQDFEDTLNQALIDASLELHNYIDMRYSTPLMPSKQIDITTTPVDILEEYDPIIIKSVCYIAAANLIRAKEGSSEEADYYHSLVTNQDRTGIIDKLNDGIYKLSSEIDANDKNGKILARLNIGSMDLIELTGEYTGERYDLLKVVSTTGGAYGTAKFQVSYLSNDQLEGKTTDPEVITGGLQHIFSGLYGRFQGSSTNSNSTWYIEVYDKGVKVTNKSNKTIEMRR